MHNSTECGAPDVFWRKAIIKDMGFHGTSDSDQKRPLAGGLCTELLKARRGAGMIKVGEHDELGLVLVTGGNERRSTQNYKQY
jgi:hypothetical protein